MYCLNTRSTEASTIHDVHYKDVRYTSMVPVFSQGCEINHKRAKDVEPIQ